jgi:hypothetical protein
MTDPETPDRAADETADETAEDVARDVMSAPGPPEVRRDRREHGGYSEYDVDDDSLAERTVQERVDAGLDAYDPDDVPPATDDPVPADYTEDELAQEIRGEVHREAVDGDWPPAPREDGFPPSHYSRE